jgi:hypothetical protein
MGSMPWCKGSRASAHEAQARPPQLLWADSQETRMELPLSFPCIMTALNKIRKWSSSSFLPGQAALVPFCTLAALAVAVPLLPSSQELRSPSLHPLSAGVSCWVGGTPAHPVGWVVPQGLVWRKQTPGRFRRAWAGVADLGIKAVCDCCGAQPPCPGTLLPAPDARAP